MPNRILCPACAARAKLDAVITLSRPGARRVVGQWHCKAHGWIVAVGEGRTLATLTWVVEEPVAEKVAVGARVDLAGWVKEEQKNGD